MIMFKRIIFAFAIFVSLCSLSVLCVSGVENTSNEVLPQEYYEALDELPTDIADKLPSGIYSESADEVSEALFDMLSTEHFIEMLSDLAIPKIKESISLLGKLCGVLLISAIFGALKNMLSSGAIASAFGFCSTCTLFAVIASSFGVQIAAVSDFFERLCSLMTSFVPISCAVWAMGGNVGSAASAGGTLYAFLGVSEVLCSRAIAPVCTLCLLFAICKGVAPNLRLSGFSSAIKKCYTFGLGFIMTLLLAILSSQSLLTAARDSIGARSAKMVTSTIIPIVGGSVSETLRTVGASVQYIKSVVGVSAIVFIIILLLPTLISLIVTRLVYLLAGSIAELLGCEAEGRLIAELGSICGLMIASASICSVMFIMGFNIFIRSSVAVGGI